MDWSKFLNAASYFCWGLACQLAVALVAMKRLPDNWTEWTMLLAGAIIAANGKLTSSTRMSPIGYSRLYPSEDERRAAVGLPPKRPGF